MTSKYYCPICGKDLHMTNDVFSICTNESCKIYTLPIPNTVSDYLEQIAQALMQSQKDLEIAREALEDIKSDYELYAKQGCQMEPNEIDMYNYACNALEQIKHKG